MTYIRSEVKAPKLSGASLTAFVAALESPLGGLLVDKLTADSGLPAFVALSAADASPLPYPLTRGHVPRADDVTLADAALAAHAQQTLTHAKAPDNSVAALRARMDAGTSPIDVWQAAEARIAHSVAAGMNLFIARHPDEVERDVQQAVWRQKNASLRSVLDGVPIVIKDELDIAGFATTLGTRFRNGVAAHDATVVARLKAAGAIILGKGNMNEVGINPIGINPHHGVCRNPHHLGHISGGSSSASAAAVGYGVCPISVGADGGGSIRIPAALCGVVGLKATHGRVPETGVPPLCFTPGHVGPIGRTTACTAALYAMMAGADDHDVASWPQPAPTLRMSSGDARGVRIGVARAHFADAAPDVVARCEQALAALVDAGATVHEIVPPDLNRVLWTHAVIILSEMAEALHEDMVHHLSQFGLDSRTNLAIARRFSAVHYVHALRHRHALTKETLAQLQEVDVIATPTTAITAPPVPEHALPKGESNLVVVDALMRFIRLANVTGLPAISVPCGKDRAGLPVGFQLMGRPYDEASLFQLAHIVERALPL